MFKVFEYNKTRTMPIAKDESDVRAGDILVLDDGVLRKAGASDSMTFANAFTFYFCNEEKKNTIDKNASIQYVGALPMCELYWGTLDLGSAADFADGLTVKAGVIAVATAGDFVFAQVEKDNGWVADTTETMFTTMIARHEQA